MGVTAKFSEESKQLVIMINDRFDFSLHQAFRDSYSAYAGKQLDYVLDLSGANYMDSSALGMILLLKDFVETNTSKLVIRNANESVRKILEIAQFHRLMTIES